MDSADISNIKATMPDWDSLPHHILEFVLKNLASQDLIRFGVVCRSWYGLVKERKRAIDMSHQVPLLIVPNERADTWNIFDTMSDKLLKSELVLPDCRRFCGSSLGWLISVNEDYTITLHKPFSKVYGRALTVELPGFFHDIPDDHYTLSDYDTRILKATISADPIENPDECVVVLAFSEMSDMAFMRPAKDTMWTTFSLNYGQYFNEVVFDGRGFYVLGKFGTLLFFTLYGKLSNFHVKTVVGKDKDLGEPYMVKNYLVKSRGGDLLRVDRYLDYTHDDLRQRVTKVVKVFKLSLKERESEWVPIKALGEASLFLGDNSSIYVHAPNFTGCRPNCVYFTDDLDPVGYVVRGPYDFDLGVYSLADESYTLHYKESSADSFSRMKARPPIWVTPILNI